MIRWAATTCTPSSIPRKKSACARGLSQRLDVDTGAEVDESLARVPISGGEWGLTTSTSPRPATGTYSFLFWDADDNAWEISPIRRALHLDLRAGRSRRPRAFRARLPPQAAGREEGARVEGGCTTQRKGPAPKVLVAGDGATTRNRTGPQVRVKIHFFRDQSDPTPELARRLGPATWRCRFRAVIPHQGRRGPSSTGSVRACLRRERANASGSTSTARPRFWHGRGVRHDSRGKRQSSCPWGASFETGQPASESPG